MKKSVRIGFGLLMAAAGETYAQQYVISTVAGGPPPTPVAALNAIVGPVGALATSAAEDLYFSSGLHCVFKVDLEGILTRVAGTCSAGYSGDGGPATGARLSNPVGLAADSDGNLYMADNGNYRVRKVSLDGIITTIAGNGTPGSSGDGGRATSARMSASALAVDSAGNLYIGDYYRVRKVTPDGIITTIAGNGFPGYSGDGGPATSARLSNPVGVAVDSDGNLYIADNGNYCVRKVSLDGIITTIAGNGTFGYSGDGGPATSAQLSPSGVALDSAGNLYIAASGRYVRKVSLNGIITTVATFSSNLVDRVAVSAAGNLYIAGDCQVRRISADGTLSAIAGNGCYSGDGGAVTAAQIDPTAVALDSAGNLFIAEAGSHRVRMVSPDGVITTVAGNGTNGYSGDGGTATRAQLQSPIGLAVDSAGNLYVADNLDPYLLAESVSRVRKVTPDGIITTVVGCVNSPAAANCYNASEGPATSAHLAFVSGLAVDPTGNLHVTDVIDGGPGGQVCHVYKVAPDGFLTTIVASGFDESGCGYSGDGGPATSARIDPSGVAVDTTGNLYIAEYTRARRVSPDGIITTIAGNGTAGYSGDGGPATSAQLKGATVAVDAAGNLYIGDFSNHRVRKVTPDGIITTIAGNGAPGYSGDGGPATSAQLNGPGGLAVDAAGNVYVVDFGNRAIRMLRPIAKDTVSNNQRGW